MVERFIFPPTYSRKDYTGMVEDVLDLIVSGTVNEKYNFKRSEVSYLLRFTPIDNKASVKGLVSGAKQSFQYGTDYTLSEDKKYLNWIGSNRPDEGSEFTIRYSIKRPSGLTDKNEGSVLRTLIEAVCVEMDNLSNKIDEVYRSGFVDTAKGTALDSVAALLAVTRKPPTRSVGKVLFWRESAPPEKTSKQTIVFDGRSEYALNESPLKSITSVTGKVKGIPFTFSVDRDYAPDPVANTIVWLAGGTVPDPKEPVTVEYKVHEKFLIPKGTIVSTSPTASGTKLFETTQESTLQKSAGRWQSVVQIQAVEPGEQGNLTVGAITKMPKPPIGVEQVANIEPISGGADYETDEGFRIRVKGALEQAGKVTLGSLRSGLESIPGVQLPILIKENPNGVPGLIKVVIDGGKMEDIEKVKEATRAAGIRVEVQRPDEVFLDFKVHLVPRNPNMSDISKEALKANANVKVKEFVAGLKIGEDLVYNQLISAILRIEEIKDVRHLEIDIYRKDKKVDSTLKGNIDVGEYERAYHRSTEVEIQGAETA